MTGIKGKDLDNLLNFREEAKEKKTSKVDVVITYKVDLAREMNDIF